mgnify:CR=1 FL=1
MLFRSRFRFGTQVAADVVLVRSSEGEEVAWSRSAAARAETLAERIRAAVRLSPLTDESVGMRPLTASIGVSSCRGGSPIPATPDELTLATMVALSAARRGGGDQVALFGESENDDMMAA